MINANLSDSANKGKNIEFDNHLKERQEHILGLL